ncbi:hypothetical protein EBB79_21745 (plasmid) [Parasedimentitalea marina]|uniref:Uncharacterized protein n=1 Tax=Parasedimentitalea marina TaxID=2483033 RepID=A0A3T0N9F4_9RHOB|nr:hypothetical protein [Parasedimentitalea marina]AZV80595.1 hypothetical protein EBB79_21745 [Parasedimentitalea marina]
MRLIAVICTLPALTAALWAGQQLWLEMRAPAAPAVVYAAPAASDRVAEPQPRPNRRWSALFERNSRPNRNPPLPPQNHNRQSHPFARYKALAMR